MAELDNESSVTIPSYDMSLSWIGTDRTTPFKEKKGVLLFFVGRGLNTKINPITADAETKWLVRVSLTYFSVSLLKKWKSCLPQLSIIRYWYCSHIVIIWNTTFFHVPYRFVCIVNLKFMFNELLFSDNFLIRISNLSIWMILRYGLDPAFGGGLENRHFLRHWRNF